MAHARDQASILRAEARILSVAGVLLLLIGFPFTLVLVALALGADAPPMLPLAAGAPLVLLGYLACDFAARRLAKAKALDLAADGDNC